jgi:hypothetical protein
MPFQKHHMIPKHSGYFGDLEEYKENPLYKVDLTPEGHACQHDILYRVFGNKFDKIACNGMRGDDDIRRQVYSEAGKRGGRAKPSRESIEKIRESKRDTKHTEETKRKMSEAHMGVKKPPMSETHRENISKSLVGNTRRRDGKKTWKPDEDYKKRMSEILKGKKKPPFSAEHKRKLSEAAKRRKKKNV